jgi:hypothetical protein
MLFLLMKSKRNIGIFCSAVCSGGNGVALMVSIMRFIFSGVSNMTLIANYPSKKACKESIGQPLNYIETSFFGPEYRENGTFVVANRPHITGKGREWFAEITMKDGLIFKVS